MKYQNSHPIVVDAMRYNEKNYNDVCEFCGNKIKISEYGGDPIFITLKADIGEIEVPIGYYIVKAKSNKIYAYSPPNFKNAFEAVNDDAGA